MKIILQISREKILEAKIGVNQGVESAPERGVNRGVERGVNYRRPPAPAKPSR